MVKAMWMGGGSTVGLAAAARDAAIVTGYHLWGPGTAERHAGVYRWHPLR